MTIPGEGKRRGLAREFTFGVIDRLRKREAWRDFLSDAVVDPRRAHPLAGTRFCHGAESMEDGISITLAANPS
jgi:hypothetical protein